VEERVVDLVGVATDGTGRAAWGRVSSGLWWIALGLVAGLGVLFFQHLPALLSAIGAEPVPLLDDPYSVGGWRAMRRTGGLMALLYRLGMVAGLLRCLTYPVRGIAPLLALFAFALGFCWIVGRVRYDQVLAHHELLNTSGLLVACGGYEW